MRNVKTIAAFVIAAALFFGQGCSEEQAKEKPQKVEKDYDQAEGLLKCMRKIYSVKPTRNEVYEAFSAPVLLGIKRHWIQCLAYRPESQTKHLTKTINDQTRRSPAALNKTGVPYKTIEKAYQNIADAKLMSTPIQCVFNAEQLKKQTANAERAFLKRRMTKKFFDYEADRKKLFLALAKKYQTDPQLGPAIKKRLAKE